MKASNRRALARIRALAFAIDASPKHVLDAVSQSMGKRVRSLISEGFDKKQAPDGKAWAKREQDKPWPLLEKSKKMRRGWRVIVASKGLTAKNQVPHTRFHQNGTRIMGARPMVPRKGQRLPDRWRVALLKTATSAFKRELKKHLAGAREG